jgi:hypothetical protein
MSNVGQTLVKGHGLHGEGRAQRLEGCSEPPCNRLMGAWGTPGHGRCSCGAYSPHLQSNYARKAWHRQHKASVASHPEGLHFHPEKKGPRGL